MKFSLFGILLALCSVAVAADSDTVLHKHMDKACAPLFAKGGMCADLVKGTRKCVRMNLPKGGKDCAKFEKAHKAFFDAGMKDEMTKKK